MSGTNGETEQSVPWADVEPIVARAARDVVGMREREGLEVVSELNGRLDALEGAAQTIEEQAPLRLKAEHERLKQAVVELTAQAAVDEQRLALEIALLADRVDITEELVRFRAHVAAARAALRSDQAVGKQLGFLAQEQLPDRFGFSVSATTRKPRGGEKDGVDYYFWKPNEFLKGVNQGKFLEHAQYGGELYGTLKSDVQRILDSGRHVLLDIEVQGAEQVRGLDQNALTIFILPSDPRVLIQRLVNRGSETPEEIQRRLERATQAEGEANAFHPLSRNQELDE